MYIILPAHVELGLSRFPSLSLLFPAFRCPVCSLSLTLPYCFLFICSFVHLIIAFKMFIRCAHVVIAPFGAWSSMRSSFHRVRCVHSDGVYIQMSHTRNIYIHGALKSADVGCIALSFHIICCVCSDDVYAPRCRRHAMYVHLFIRSVMRTYVTRAFRCCFVFYYITF